MHVHMHTDIQNVQTVLNVVVLMTKTDDGAKLECRKACAEIACTRFYSSAAQSTPLDEWKTSSILTF